MKAGKHWTVRDHYGNSIYLTNERWAHIIDPVNHPEMSDFDNHLYCHCISKRNRVKLWQSQSLTTMK